MPPTFKKKKKKKKNVDVFKLNIMFFSITCVTVSLFDRLSKFCFSSVSSLSLSLSHPAFIFCVFLFKIFMMMVFIIKSACVSGLFCCLNSVCVRLKHRFMSIFTITNDNLWSLYFQHYFTKIGFTGFRFRSWNHRYLLE